MVRHFHYSHFSIFVNTGNLQGSIKNFIPKGRIEAEIAMKLFIRLISPIGFGRIRSRDQLYFPGLPGNDTLQAADK